MFHNLGQTLLQGLSFLRRMLEAFFQFPVFQLMLCSQLFQTLFLTLHTRKTLKRTFYCCLQFFKRCAFHKRTPSKSEIRQFNMIIFSAKLHSYSR